MRPTSSCPPHRDGDPCGYAHWCGCADRARAGRGGAQATEAADVHEALDIGRDLATKVAFHLVVLFEFLTDLVHFVGGKIINVALPVHTGGAQDLQGRSTADAIDIGERNVHTFATRQINTCNSRHSTSPALALALLVPGVFADNSKNTLAPDHLALGAYFFDGRSDFHDSSPMSGKALRLCVTKVCRCRKHNTNPVNTAAHRPSAAGTETFIHLYLLCQQPIVVRFRPRSEMLRMRGPSGVMATLCSKCAARRRSRVTAVHLSSRTSTS